VHSPFKFDVEYNKPADYKRYTNKYYIGFIDPKNNLSIFSK
jgi:hypothetical protein